MDVRVGFVIILQVLLVFSNICFQIVSGALPPQKQIVADGISVIKGIRKNFELDVSGERTTRNQLFNAYNAFGIDLFKSLQHTVFIIEDSKANSILNVLRATPDLICANRIKGKIDDIKLKEAKKLYQYCAAEIDAQIKNIKQDLTSGQQLIYTAFIQAQEAIRACERAYTRNKNLNELESCVKQAGNIVQAAASRFESVFEKRSSQNILTLLAKCTDTTILGLINALNANYDDLAICLQSSNNVASRKLASVISTEYKLTFTSNEAAYVAIAIKNIFADAPAVLEKLDAVLIRVEAVLADSNRDRVILKGLIASNEEVINYQNGFSTALGNLGGAGKACARSGQSRMQIMINTKTEDWKRCLTSIKATPFVTEINQRQKSIIARENKEGFVAIIKCVSSTILSTDNTVSCSQKADANFVSFLEENTMKLTQDNLNVDMIEVLVKKCETSVFSTIHSGLVANEVIFDNCLAKASINYKLL